MTGYEHQQISDLIRQNLFPKTQKCNGNSKVASITRIQEAANAAYSLTRANAAITAFSKLDSGRAPGVSHKRQQSMIKICISVLIRKHANMRCAESIHNHTKPSGIVHVWTARCQCKDRQVVTFGPSDTCACIMQPKVASVNSSQAVRQGART